VRCLTWTTDTTLYQHAVNEAAATSPTTLRDRPKG
jgi:hypothetical protein